MPEWLKEITDQMREMEGWPDGEFPRLAVETLNEVSESHSWSDDVACLVHLLIEKVEKLGDGIIRIRKVYGDAEMLTPPLDGALLDLLNSICDLNIVEEDKK